MNLLREDGVDIELGISNARAKAKALREAVKATFNPPNRCFVKDCIRPASPKIGLCGPHQDKLRYLLVVKKLTVPEIAEMGLVPPGYQRRWANLPKNKVD